MSAKLTRKSFFFNADEDAAIRGRSEEHQITQTEYMRMLVRKDSNINDVESAKTRRPYIQPSEDEQISLEYLCQLEMVFNVVVRIAQSIDELGDSSNALEMMKVFEEVHQLNHLIRWYFAGVGNDNDNI